MPLQGGGHGEWVCNRDRVSVLQDERASVCGEGSRWRLGNSANLLNTPDLCTKVKGNVTLYIFYHDVKKRE